MTTLISTQNVSVRGQSFTTFQMVELTDEQRFDDGIDLLQSYTNRGFVEQMPPEVLPKYWKIDNGQVLEMTDSEKTAVDQAETDSQAQAVLNEELRKLNQDIAFGQTLFKQYILDNRKIQGLTVEQVMAQGQYGVSLKLMLDSGSLTTAKAFISQIPDNLFLSGSKALYISKIDQYLNQ